MITNVLVFLLGVLVASLAALLFAPVLWRKAQVFARREYEATIPVTANEIRAEFDRVRAEAAMQVRQGEITVTEMRAKTGAAQAELGRANVEIAALRKRGKDMEAEMAAFAAERDSFRQTFAAFQDKERVLADSLDEAQRDGSLNAEELEALAVRFREMSDLAEERKVELVAAETRIERLSGALRALERSSVEKDTQIRLLRSEAEKSGAGGAGPRQLAGAGVMPGRARRLPEAPTLTVVPRAPAETAADGLANRTEASLRAMIERGDGGLTAEDRGEVREQIAALAADVIYRTARTEGAGKPLAPFLEAGDGVPDGDGEPPTLAERVRRIAARESGSPRHAGESGLTDG